MLLEALRWVLFLLLWVCSYTIPLCAALGKGIGNSYGLLCLIAGVTTLTFGMIAGPLWCLMVAVVASSVLISLCMEGWHTAHGIQACARRVLGKNRPSQPYAKNGAQCLYRPWLYPFAFLFGMLVALFTALSKGANMAFGALGIMHVACADLGGLLLCAITFLSITLVSMGKEGREWMEGMTGRTMNFWGCRAPRCVSIVLPLVAAFTKGLGYGYGALRLFVLLGMVTPVLQPIAYLLVVVVGFSIVLVSLGMEGKSLHYSIRNMGSYDHPQKEKARVMMHKGPFFWSLLIPMLCAFGKGATMGTGTLLILSSLLGLPMVAPSIVAASIMAAVSVALVSLGKEGMDFFYGVNYFKIPNLPPSMPEGESWINPVEDCYGYAWLFRESSSQSISEISGPTGRSTSEKNWSVRTAL